MSNQRFKRSKSTAAILIALLLTGTALLTSCSPDGREYRFTISGNGTGEGELSPSELYPLLSHLFPAVSDYPLPDLPVTTPPISTPPIITVTMPPSVTTEPILPPFTLPSGTLPSVKLGTDMMNEDISLDGTLSGYTQRKNLREKIENFVELYAYARSTIYPDTLQARLNTISNWDRNSSLLADNIARIGGLTYKGATFVNSDMELAGLYTNQSQGIFWFVVNETVTYEIKNRSYNQDVSHILTAQFTKNSSDGYTDAFVVTQDWAIDPASAYVSGEVSADSDDMNAISDALAKQYAVEDLPADYWKLPKNASDQLVASGYTGEVYRLTMTVPSAAGSRGSEYWYTEYGELIRVDWP